MQSDVLEITAQAAWAAYCEAVGGKAFNGDLWDEMSQWDLIACEAVGGKAFNGDSLPAWSVMVADSKKKQIVAGWRAAANAAVTAFYLSTVQ